MAETTYPAFDDTYWEDHKHPAEAKSAILVHYLEVHYGQKVPEPTPKKFILHEWLARLERGALLYQNCTMKELRSFIIARGLPEPKPINKGVGMSSATLVKILDRADMKAKFNLLALPVEVRGVILKRYFQTLRPCLRAPAAPPIARACKQLWTESMPIFFATCDFRVPIHCQLMRDHLVFGYDFQHLDTVSYDSRDLDEPSLEDRTFIPDTVLTWLGTLKQRDFDAMTSIKLDFPSCCSHLCLGWNKKKQRLSVCTGSQEWTECQDCGDGTEIGFRLQCYLDFLPAKTKLNKALIERLVIVLDQLMTTYVHLDDL